MKDGTVRAESSSTDLLQADALNLPFADSSFDVVFLSHVLTAVSDPERCLREALRVAREGATVVLVNHFRSSWAVAGWMETALDPLCRRLGWRSDLSLEYLLAQAEVNTAGAKRVGQGTMFRIVYLHKRRDDVRTVQNLPLRNKKAKLEIGRV